MRNAGSFSVRVVDGAVVLELVVVLVLVVLVCVLDVKVALVLSAVGTLDDSVTVFVFEPQPASSAPAHRPSASTPIRDAAARGVIV
jgi:hypothetical protein